MFRHNFFKVFRFIVLNLIKNRNLWSIKTWSRYEYIFVTLLNLFTLGLCGLSQHVRIQWSDSTTNDWYKTPTFKSTDNVGYNILFSFLMLFGLFGLTTLESISRPPSNSPLQFLKWKATADNRSTTKTKNSNNDDKNEKSILVCIGDSITHGQCSANYVSMIETCIKDPNKLITVNAGQNSICSWSFLQSRIDEVVCCNPGYVSILIGTNDIKGIYNNEWKQQSINRWKIPQDLSFQNYKRNMQSIIEKLVKGTNAKIAVCTLPPMGEDVHCKANDFVRKANEIIKDIVSKFGKESDRVSCIHVFDEFEKYWGALKGGKRAISTKWKTFFILISG